MLLYVTHHLIAMYNIPSSSSRHNREDERVDVVSVPNPILVRLCLLYDHTRDFVYLHPAWSGSIWHVNRLSMLFACTEPAWPAL